MIVIKQEDIVKDGVFIFPGEATIANIYGEKFFYINEPDELFVTIQLDILRFSFESPFAGGIEPEKTDEATAHLKLPLEAYPDVSHIPFKVGDKFECFWKDGFGMNGLWIIKGLHERIS